MATRIIHLIHTECDIYVQRISPTNVRVRVTEKDPELTDPTDFEIEGSSAHIADALASIASVLVNLEDLMTKEPN